MLISHLDVFFFYCSIMQGKWYLKSHNPLLKALVSFYSSGANAICYEHVTFLNVSSNKQGRRAVHVNFESQKFSTGNCGGKRDLKPQQEFQTQLTESSIKGDTSLHENKLTKWFSPFGEVFKEQFKCTKKYFVASESIWMFQLRNLIATWFSETLRDFQQLG